MSSCLSRPLPAGAGTTPPTCATSWTRTASSWCRTRIPYGGTFRGVDAVIGWFTRELWRWFDEFTSTPEDLIDARDRIVVPVHVQARAKNGKTMDVHNGWVYEFSEG